MKQFSENEVKNFINKRKSWDNFVGEDTRTGSARSYYFRYKVCIAKKLDGSRECWVNAFMKVDSATKFTNMPNNSCQFITAASYNYNTIWEELWQRIENYKQALIKKYDQIPQRIYETWGYAQTIFQTMSNDWIEKHSWFKDEE